MTCSVGVMRNKSKARLHYRGYRSTVFHVTELTIKTIYSYLAVYQTDPVSACLSLGLRTFLYLQRSIGYLNVLYRLFGHFH